MSYVVVLYGSKTGTLRRSKNGFNAPLLFSRYSYFFFQTIPFLFFACWKPVWDNTFLWKPVWNQHLLIYKKAFFCCWEKPFKYFFAWLKNYFIDNQILEFFLKKKLKKNLRVMFFAVFLQSQTTRGIVRLSLDVL